MAETTGLRGRPLPIGRRGWIAILLVAAAVWSWSWMGLSPHTLVPRAGGAAVARDFFAAALSPALDYEAAFVPAGSPAFLARVVLALRRTVVFAAAAMSLALVAGTVLGVLASGSWWASDPCARRRWTRWVGPAVRVLTRLAIAGLRSVHELLWAVLFLAAVGLNTASAVLAIAIPFTGTLAKVFSEVIDEAPDDAAVALRATGAGPLSVFLFGRLPRALPDMAAYAFYRFECAVRSSAVLGFFGYETLGYYLRASFENLHYREVWTYLYALVGLVLLLELWSALLRRRLIA